MNLYNYYFYYYYYINSTRCVYFDKVLYDVYISIYFDALYCLQQFRINNIIEDFFENLIFKEIIDENTKTTILNRQEFLFTNYNILFNLIKNKLQIFEDVPNFQGREFALLHFTLSLEITLLKWLS